MLTLTAILALLAGACSINTLTYEEVQEARGLPIDREPEGELGFIDDDAGESLMITELPADDAGDDAPPAMQQLDSITLDGPASTDEPAAVSDYPPVVGDDPAVSGTDEPPAVALVPDSGTAPPTGDAADLPPAAVDLPPPAADVVPDPADAASGFTSSAGDAIGQGDAPIGENDNSTNDNSANDNSANDNSADGNSSNERAVIRPPVDTDDAAAATSGPGTSGQGTSPRGSAPDSVPDAQTDFLADPDTENSGADAIQQGLLVAQAHGYPGALLADDNALVCVASSARAAVGAEAFDTAIATLKGSPADVDAVIGVMNDCGAAIAITDALASTFYELLDPVFADELTLCTAENFEDPLVLSASMQATLSAGATPEVDLNGIDPLLGCIGLGELTVGGIAEVSDESRLCLDDEGNDQLLVILDSLFNDFAIELGATDLAAIAASCLSPDELAAADGFF